MNFKNTVGIIGDILKLYILKKAYIYPTYWAPQIGLGGVGVGVVYSTTSGYILVESILCTDSLFS